MLTIYIILLILFVLVMGLVIGVALGYKNDERFQLIVSNGYKYSWLISFLGVTVAYSLHKLSFINLEASLALNICMFIILISGIFNGLFVYISHKRV